MRVVMTIKLSKPTLGQDLMDALKAVAGDEYAEARDLIIDDQSFFVVGRSSGYSYECVAIAHGENYTNTSIDPIGLYQNIAVIDYIWPESGRYMVDSTEEGVIDAVRQFRFRLDAYLNITIH